MLAFTHIPKTAGTTLNYILQKNFGPKLHAIIQRNGFKYSYEDFKCDQLIYPNAKCISGHVLKPFVDYKEYNKELQWFTFLRNPIRRFVSQYIHQQTGSLVKYRMPIQNWADTFHRSNWQVKWIAGEENLLAAKQIIEEKFIFIGITEDFDRSLQIMNQCFDYSLDITYSKPKMVVRDSSLKDDLLNTRFDELLPFYQEQNNLDIQLYEYVKEEVFPSQERTISRRCEEKRISSLQETFNLWSYKAKRNLIYKPYVQLNK